MKINNPRLLLARLREADYAHAGNEEAIDIVFGKVFDILNNKSFFLGANDLIHCNEQKSGGTFNVLDVGCDLGGTADYVQKIGNFNVFGIDVDENAILHGKKIIQTLVSQNAL